MNRTELEVVEGGLVITGGALIAGGAFIVGVGIGYWSTR
ncbi:MAG: hypothetical protein ACRC6X_04465 [Culicoidibacterales bacterium]